MKGIFQYFIEEFQLPFANPVLIFSLLLFIVLLAPILLKRFNIPGIIGLIISGVIIGPYGLNIIAKNPAVDLFSTIGLLYIMFIAGLDLDINEFRANRNKSLLFGFFTFIIPLSIGFPVCFYLLGYGFNASLLTSSMFATHTLVAYPVVSKLGIAKNLTVAIIVGGTIITDTAVLIILAVILGNSQGVLNTDFLVRLGLSLAIFLLIIFLIMPKVARWIFQKMESEKYAHYIFVLSILFLSAFLSEVAGLEPIIGAFIAGLALNRLIPPSSPLMNRIEFIGNALFIPIFLISVGMIVDVGVLFYGPRPLIIAAVLTGVAIFGKWTAAFLTQISLKFSRLQRRLIFGLSSSHAAATLAVILVGYRSGILDENILNGTIILILITCLVASFVTEGAAKKLAISDNYLLRDKFDPLAIINEHILLPVANLFNLSKLLELAFLIRGRNSTNPVSVLSVVPDSREAELKSVNSRVALQEYIKKNPENESKVSILSTIDHNVAGGIARTSQEVLADIIIMGWPARSGIMEKFFGEKIDNIIHSVDKNLFVCYIKDSMYKNKRMIAISPPLAEREKGFGLWVSKLTLLAGYLNIQLVHYGDIKTQYEMKHLISKMRSSISVIYEKFDNWENIMSLSHEIKQDDLLVMISSRRGSVSYLNTLDNIPFKLEKCFERNNKIIIYPQHYDIKYIDVSYKEIPSGFIARGIQKIIKAGVRLFKKFWPKK